MMSSVTVIVLESFAPNVVVRWGINFNHIAANGDDAHFDNRSVHYSILFFDYGVALGASVYGSLLC